MQTRENALHQWLKTIYPSNDYSLVPLAGDASFRRYYRLIHDGISQIVMDTPPDKLKLEPFVQVSNLLAEQGIKTPKIHALDDSLGFALLEDFGDILFSEALRQQDPQALYPSAIQVLMQMQQNHSQLNIPLPVFDQGFMLQELTLFSEWFLQRYLGLNLQAEEHQLIQNTFQMLTLQIANQPPVLVHRDYHSRNIMLLDSADSASHTLGIIDFQDAVLGPITYDLVSLLKDCYIQLPNKELNEWVQYFYDHSSLAQQVPFSEFQRAFDWCGLQRHLRILGTFCRLHLRDAKSNYLNDLPRTYQYVITCIDKHPEFQAFGQWLKQRVDPYFQSTAV